MFSIFHEFIMLFMRSFAIHRVDFDVIESIHPNILAGHKVLSADFVWATFLLECLADKL